MNILHTEVVSVYKLNETAPISIRCNVSTVDMSMNKTRANHCGTV